MTGRGSAVAAAPPFFFVVLCWFLCVLCRSGLPLVPPIGELIVWSTDAWSTDAWKPVFGATCRNASVGSGGNGDAAEGTSARPWLTRATEECARFWSSSVAPNGQASDAMSRNRW